MRKIFAILLSMQMIVAPVAIAADETSPSPDANSSDAYYRTGSGSADGYDFFINQVLILATGILGSNIISHCSKAFSTASLPVFISGSLVHIGSEIVLANQNGESYKRKLSDLEMLESKMQKSGGTLQKDALESALKDEQATVAFLTKRINWLIAVDVIYLAAMALAIAEEVGGHASAVTRNVVPAATKCTQNGAKAASSGTATGWSCLAFSTIPTASAAAYCASLALIPTAAVQAEANFANQESNNSAKSVCTSLFTAPVSAGASAGSALITACSTRCYAEAALLTWPPAAATAAGLCASTAVTASSSLVAWYAPTNLDLIKACENYLSDYLDRSHAGCKVQASDGGGSKLSMSKLLGMAFAFGTGKMKGGEISDIGSQAVGILPMLGMVLPGVVDTVSKTVVASYNYAIPRSVTFGVASAFVTAVISGLVTRRTAAEGNVAKLQKVVDQFVLLDEGGLTTGGTSGGSGGSGGSSGGTSGGNIPKPQDNKFAVKKLELAGVPKKCLSNSGGNWGYSTSSCSNPVQVSRPNFNSSSGLPANLVSAASLGSDMANALGSGDLDKVDKISTQLGSMAVGIRELNKKMQEKYNEEQRKNKKPTTDFDKAIKAQIASMGSQVQSVAKANGMTLPSSGTASLTKETEVNEPVQNVVASTAPAMPEVPEAGMDLSGDSATTTDEVIPDVSTASTTTNSLDQFESTVQDIAPKSDVSIFKQVSNRYILNYTRIFDQKEPEVIKEAPKN